MHTRLSCRRLTSERSWNRSAKQYFARAAACSPLNFSSANSANSALEAARKGGVGAITTTMAAKKDFLSDLVVVRKCDGEDDMKIKMLIPPTGKQRNLCRQKEEPIAKPLDRIRMAVSSAYSNKKDKRNKKKKKSDPTDADVKEFGGTESPTLFSCTMLDQFGKPVPESTANSEAWHTGYTLELKYTTKDDEVEVKKLKIESNLPTCSDLSLPKTIIAGDIWTSPNFSLEFCSTQDCEWCWFVEEQGEWIRIGGGAPECKIDVRHVGKRLKVSCEPRCDGRIGERMETVSEDLISDALDLHFMESRHKHMLQRSSEDTLRIMTYNVLADVYAKTDYAQNVLYPDISKNHLSMDYRQQLTLFEIGGFDSDIVCMQEVDSIWYDKFWSPRMSLKGYSGIFGPKTSKVEGCALFWRVNKLRVVSQESIHIRNLFSDSLWLKEHLGEHNASTLAKDKNLCQILGKISTAVQFALFETNSASASKEKLLVVNTHLYFHPGASHIRALSVALILAYAADLLSKQNFFGECAVFFCGDLNSEPDTAAIELFANGSVSSDHHEWHDCTHFTWKGRDDDVQGFELDEELKYELKVDNEHDTGCSRFELTNPFGRLVSSDGLRSAFTNYVKGYIGSLDYIFYSGEKMKLENFAPLPLEGDLCERGNVGEGGEILKQGYLPSQFFPSDHVSLVADFSLQDSKSDGKTDISYTWPPPEDRPVMPLPASRWNEGKAAECLKQGKIIALPTDTIYGVGALASSAEGIDKLYEAKRRNINVPLALCIAHPRDIGSFGDVSHIPEGLVEKLLPGPYTLLLVKKDSPMLSKELNPNAKLVGIRVPEASFVRGIVARLGGGAMALTSANISGQQSSTSVNQFREIWQHCSHVYDGGQLNAGSTGSTIIDLSNPSGYSILRPGNGLEEAQQILTSYGIQKL